MKTTCLIVLITQILFASCKKVEKETTIVHEQIAFQNKQIDSVEPPQKTNVLDSVASGLQFTPKLEYALTRKKIDSTKKQLVKLYRSAINPQDKKQVINKASKYFEQALLQDIIPHWYGTEWDFNGYTNIPNKGEIACGYFVSTTLKHMGVQLNRYKMAQQASKLEVESVGITKANVSFFYKEKVNTGLKELKEGIYIVGLDNHVGYIYKHKKVVYFIHSSYITDRVMVELASNSEAFYGNHYYLAPITNDAFIIKWLLGETLMIKTP